MIRRMARNIAHGTRGGNAQREDKEKGKFT